MMRSILFTAIFILATFFCASAQTIIKENKVKALPETREMYSSLRGEEGNFPTPQTTPTPKPTPQTSVTIPYVRPDAKTRFKRAAMGIAGPSALAKTVVSAGYGTWRNSPEEWGDRWEGFGRRVASSFGKGVIKQSTVYVLDEALKVDSHYYRSKKKDFGSKLSNALLSTVTARNTEGKRVFGIPRIAGTYVSSVVAAEAWYPSRFNYKDGLRSGTISLGIGAVFNIFKEFVLKK